MADDNSGEIRMSLSLIAIIVFVILLFMGWISINFSSIILLLATLYGMATLSFEEEKRIDLIIFIASWLIFLGLSLALPEYRFSFILILISVIVTLSASWETKILVVGFTILNILFFGATVLSFIEFLAIVLFLNAARNSVGYGAIMLIPLLAVGWLIGSGWGNIIEQKAESFNTEISVKTGFDTGNIGQGLNSALNSTWLLFTNPEEWHRITFLETGNRDEGANSMALEITKIEAIPPTVELGDSFDIAYTLENKGKEPARNVMIMAKGDEITESCGKVNYQLCNPYCEGAGEATSCSFARMLENIQKKDERYETISFSAPPCPGTYAVGVKAQYTYTVYGITFIKMISRGYYEELQRNDKIDLEDVESTSSAGPFKIALRANRLQPIPDKTYNGEFQNFTIYVSLINEHAGTAVLNAMEVHIPEILTPSDINSNHCGLKYLIDDNRVDSTVGGYVRYIPEDISGRVEKNGIKFYKCEFYATNPIELEKTFDIKAEVDYNFTYFKQTTVRVRGSPGTAGVADPDCEKKLKISDATSTEQKKPQTKEEILKSLAKKSVACYLDNTKGWDGWGETCSKINILFENCDDITIAELRKEVEKIKPEAKDNIFIKDISGNTDPEKAIISGKRDYKNALIEWRRNDIPYVFGAIPVIGAPVHIINALTEGSVVITLPKGTDKKECESTEETPPSIT